MRKPLEQAHDFLAEILTPKSVAVDATMGQGFDTLFLAQRAGRVYAFDIQEQALAMTQKRLGQQFTQVKLIHDSHERVADYVKEPINAAIFNLGYLPRADKSVITRPETTLAALEQILLRLVAGGRLSVMVYYGHEGGLEEKNRVLDFLSQLPQEDFSVMSYQALNQINCPPFLVMVEKLAKGSD
ncbi:class I SAM-dependent methyltransferase [Streptococcus cuniculipharyngis]|uniref:16S rRNA (Cytosine(1402)-N(4))-methyltransferase n=1 Tax=Streptococcus cuniculipharyngis TaxID=1562651 RepID=A0A5C5SAE8_9STRE|nr:class I SAM-dependent methyltransferase [Streptococcus cuniculipharyngis]TWS96663.1 16S rRNA (cytosine(1402)-N(4))-methyltransferase [Streptococcus cuniculipharyngis]